MSSSCVSPKDFKATAPESKQHPAVYAREYSQWHENVARGDSQEAHYRRHCARDFLAASSDDRIVDVRDDVSRPSRIVLVRRAGCASASTYLYKTLSTLQRLRRCACARAHMHPSGRRIIFLSRTQSSSCPLLGSF